MTLHLLLALALFPAATAAVLYVACRSVYQGWRFRDREYKSGRFCRPVRAYLYEHGKRAGDPLLPIGSPGSRDYWDCTYIYHYDTKRGEAEKFYDCDFLERPPEEIMLYLTPFGVRGPNVRCGKKRDGFIRPADGKFWRWIPVCLAVVLVMAFGVLSLSLIG